MERRTIAAIVAAVAAVGVLVSLYPAHAVGALYLALVIGGPILVIALVAIATSIVLKGLGEFVLYAMKPRPAGPTHARFRLQTAFAIVSLLCVVLAGLVAYWPRFPSVAAVETVKVGMTEGQVRKVLGTPFGTSTQARRVEMHYWVSPFAQFQVDIVLSDGRVSEKRFWRGEKRVPEPR